MRPFDTLGANGPAGAVVSGDATSLTPRRTTGSLSRRMILISTAWITVLLAGGGFALDRVLVAAVTHNFDDQLEYVLRSLLVSAEIGPDGEVLFGRDAAADQRFLEPYSGLYWQVSARVERPVPVAVALGSAAGLWRRA